MLVNAGNGGPEGHFRGKDCRRTGERAEEFDGSVFVNNATDCSEGKRPLLRP